jgi:capsule polysaccharide modification protein KpsS
MYVRETGIGRSARGRPSLTRDLEKSPMEAASFEAAYAKPANPNPDRAFARVRSLSPVTRIFPLRRFLFLQGVPGSFMHRLGLALTARGHGVSRVNFNGGDRLSWPSLPAIDFTGQMSEWPAFAQRLMFEIAPTDLILHGDCRPLHKVAIHLAERCGITVHVFEEGYLRPNWITLEVGGVNGYSRLHEASRPIVWRLPCYPHLRARYMSHPRFARAHGTASATD